MKHIASFLLATFVAFSSFAQSQPWTALGAGKAGTLYVRNVEKPVKGEFTAEFRLDYQIDVKTGDGDLLERSFMKVKMNCFSRDAKLLSDVHASKGALLPKYKDFWVKTGDQWSIAANAGKLTLDKVCPQKNIT